MRILIFLFFLILIGCSRYYNHSHLYDFDKPELSLKMNGYYYSIKTKKDSVNKREEFIVSQMFLYSNGSSYFEPYNPIEKTNMINTSMKAIYYIENEYKQWEKEWWYKAFGWSTYSIKSNEFRMRYYGMGMGSLFFGSDNYLNELKGRVLNDTTFIIDYRYRYWYGKENPIKDTVNMVYHFRKYTPKPDSLNWTMKWDKRNDK